MTKYLLIAIALVLCAELALRAVGFSAPALYRPDRELGWTLRPELPGVNAAGWRDREHLLAKPEGVYRIAVLGDEYSEARRLPPQQAWWRRLPQHLEACGLAPRKRLEVLNFAVAGYGTAQQYIQLQTEVMRYRPDLVLLQFNGADDVRNNSFLLDPQKDRPFFMFDASGALAIDDSFNAGEGFRRRSSLKYEVLRRLADRARVVQLVARLADSSGSSGTHAGAEPHAVWEEAWRVTESLVGASDDYVRAHGARLVLVFVPPEQRVEAFASHRGIATIALQAGLDHRSAAAIVAQELCGPAARPPYAASSTGRLPFRETILKPGSRTTIALSGTSL